MLTLRTDSNHLQFFLDVDMCLLSSFHSIIYKNTLREHFVELNNNQTTQLNLPQSVTPLRVYIATIIRVLYTHCTSTLIRKSEKLKNPYKQTFH